MITISSVLGVGLYIRGGTILRLAGPLAVLLSFALLGALAWGVMQCIAEMLCIWPISGALSVYVTEFVDVELGIAVGVAYWYVIACIFDVQFNNIVQVHICHLLFSTHRCNGDLCGVLGNAQEHPRRHSVLLSTSCSSRPQCFWYTGAALQQRIVVLEANTLPDIWVS
jgi:amino acid transporter